MKAEIEMTIKIPVTFNFCPGEPATFSDPGALADVSDIDFDIDEAEAAIWEQLETPETLTELHEHAEAEIQAEKDEAKIAKWEAQNDTI
jgi:hypothetical protein